LNDLKSSERDWKKDCLSSSLSIQNEEDDPYLLPFASRRNIKLIDPFLFRYVEFERQAKAILTDSGGVQKEPTGSECLVLP